MKIKMLLSIIIPAYNVEEYIENCIDSIENQDLSKEDYEVIIINDGSKDKTKDICEKLKGKYSNIVLIDVKNGGQSKARNLGINLAKGEFIEFIDSDDYIAYNVLGTIAKLAKESIDLICFKSKYVKELDKKECEILTGEVKTYQNGKECFIKEDINNGPWWYWVRKELLDNNNLRFIEGRLCEDGMFTCKLFSIAQKTVYTSYDVYRYVNREGSTCKKYDINHQKKMISDFVYAIQYFDKLGEENKTNSSSKYIDVLEQRKYSYIFFLQVRLVRLGDYKYAKEVLEKLKISGLYPYKWIPYNSLKFKVLNILFKNKNMFLTLCIGMGLLNKIRR